MTRATDREDSKFDSSEFLQGTYVLIYEMVLFEISGNLAITIQIIVFYCRHFVWPRELRNTLNVTIVSA